jgi:hypothetical protein
MNKLEVLLMVAARLDGLCESHLIDLEIALRKHGYDDDEIRAVLEEARAVNRESVRDVLQTTEELLDSCGSSDVRRVSFSDRLRSEPTLTLH